uniref:RRM domain-containing protein n=1 Tax=Helicotheca tamesis TaxID=374047 RepID=A0A7S2I2F1_9STRA|mmetsp:Transcript_4848/g.6629  ORF Transcript_4848/g.6629 Transcript_4848/m.6629 type:complete len:317 (+) Transcript_4848:899-1849(+)
MFDRETRRSRGFGFVTFEDESVARAVLDLGAEHSGEDLQDRRRTGRIIISGKSCEVKAAEPKEASTSTSVHHSGGRNGAIAKNNSFNDRHFSNRKIAGCPDGGKSKVGTNLTREKSASDGGNNRDHNPSRPCASQVAENMFPPDSHGSYQEAVPFHYRQEALPYGVQGHPYANYEDTRQTAGVSVGYNPGNVAPGSYYPVPMAAPIAPVADMHNPYVAYSPHGPQMMWPYANGMYDNDSVPVPCGYVTDFTPVSYPPDGGAHAYYQYVQTGAPCYYPMMMPPAMVAGHQEHVAVMDSAPPDDKNSIADGKAKATLG